MISVIVPIYNVEEYLKRCIDSIINQTYRNLEIILVDDGATDNCPLIADEYKKIDKRIKVIHKTNGGLSDARNAGIEIATGEYLMFIDSDDEINENMISILYDNLKKHDADISICGYQKIYIGDDIKKVYKEYDVKVCKYNLFENMYNTYGKYTIVAWNKLYKKELFETLRYPKGKVHEDEFVIHELLKKCNTLVYDTRELYYYYQRNNSITSNFNLKRLNAIEALEERLSFFKDDKKMYDMTMKSYCLRLMYCYAQMDSYKKERKELKNKFNENYKLIINSKYLSITDKIKILIAKVSPKLLFNLMNKKNRN